MRGEGGMHGMHPHEIQPVIARAVRILLECILVWSCYGIFMESYMTSVNPVTFP